MNAVVLIGRLTKDPDIRYIPQTETAVATFTLAVDRPMAKEKTADFIRCVCFGKTAELVEKYVGKGRQICVRGRIQTGSYEDKDGKKVYTTDVYADRVEFLGRGDGANKESSATGMTPAADPNGFAALDDDDDDIPF